MEKVYIVRQRIVEYYAIKAHSEEEAMQKLNAGVVDPFETEQLSYTIEEEYPY